MVNIVKNVKNYKRLSKNWNKSTVSQWVSEWVSEWQGHLLSCSGQLKNIVDLHHIGREVELRNKKITNGGKWLNLNLIYSKVILS